ncbi:hypothetical protein BUV99_13290, partial [Corynebacterium diphtheriae]
VDLSNTLVVVTADHDHVMTFNGYAARTGQTTEMTSKAIDALQAQSHGQGYFLMVEGGRIDHALHANNAKRALQETKAFNDAIQTALDKVDLSNTLVVVTADHDHVMTFNGYAARTGQTTE